MSSTNSTTLPPLPVVATRELADTFGVLLVAFIFTVTLYGLTFFQTYIYYTRFPHDERGSKYTVGLLWAVDTALTTLISHTIYHYLITDFILPFTFLDTTKTFIAEEAISVFLALVVQCYYAFRIWTVGGRRSVIPAVIVVFALSAFAFNLASVSKMTDQMLFHEVISKSVKLTKGICWGLSVAADLLITASMLWYLRESANPGMATPEGWYERIVVYGVNRGTSFAIIQTVSLITLVTLPNQQVWILFHWVGSKVYINSILSMLNFRNAHRGRGIPEEAPQNQHARDDSDRYSGTFTTRSGSGAGPLDTSHSVHFNVPGGADTKNAEAMNIELDTVRAQGEVEGTSYGDTDSSGGGEKAEAPSAVSGGPSKHRDVEAE